MSFFFFAIDRWSHRTQMASITKVYHPWNLLYREIIPWSTCPCSNGK
jgi:hypothetical protein